MFQLQCVTPEAILAVIPKGEVFGIPSKEFGIRLFLARLDFTGFAMKIVQDIFDKKKVPRLLRTPIEALLRHRLDALFNKMVVEMGREVSEENIRMLLVLFPSTVTVQTLIEDIASHDFPDRVRDALEQLPDEIVGGSRQDLYDMFMEIRVAVQDGITELNKVYAEAG